jgi:hypothetical protein
MQKLISEHSVIIKFKYGLDSLDPLHRLEIELDQILKQSNAGYCDGHEIAIDLSHGFIFLYGSNAEIIFKAVKPLLDSCAFMRRASANLRFGPQDIKCPEFELTIDPR